MESKTEIFTQRVKAGKRTYFFDVKSTRAEEHYITITESKRVGFSEYEKHKIFLYKEDFDKFLDALSSTIGHIKDNLNPEDEPELVDEQVADDQD